MKTKGKILLFTIILFVTYRDLLSQVKYIEISVDQSGYESCLTGIASDFGVDAVKLYPNPANDIFTIELNDFKENSELELKLYDINGKLSYETQILVNSSSKFKKQINLTQLPEGLYYTKLTCSEKTFYCQMIISKK